MKSLLFWVGGLFIIIAAAATPLSIILGVYDWVGNDVEFKNALWFGIKCWASMLSIGLVVGVPCFIIGKD